MDQAFEATLVLVAGSSVVLRARVVKRNAKLLSSLAAGNAIRAKRPRQEMSCISCQKGTSGSRQSLAISPLTADATLPPLAMRNFHVVDVHAVTRANWVVRRVSVDGTMMRRRCPGPMAMVAPSKASCNTCERGAPL